MALPGINNAVRQLFTYDAYGNAIGFNMAAAATVLLYSGEQFDQHAMMQYLRARFYDAANGRFVGLDPFVGNKMLPTTFHRYSYLIGDPINDADPSGMLGSGAFSKIIRKLVQKAVTTKWGRGGLEAIAYALSKALIGTNVTYTLGHAYVRENGRNPDDVDINKAIARLNEFDDLEEEAQKVFEQLQSNKPDILDRTPGAKQFYEIKPKEAEAEGVAQLGVYEPLILAVHPGAVRGHWRPQQPVYMLESSYGIPLVIRIKAWLSQDGCNPSQPGDE